MVFLMRQYDGIIAPTFLCFCCFYTYTENSLFYAKMYKNTQKNIPKKRLQKRPQKSLKKHPPNTSKITPKSTPKYSQKITPKNNLRKHLKNTQKIHLKNHNTPKPQINKMVESFLA